MSKFVIECPNCGRYAEAKTGFFARKKIECSCGNVINVRTDKLASRTCPHCGNNVVYDQSKGEKAKCPVCGEPVMGVNEHGNMMEFSCAQCGVRLSVKQGAATYTCPVCDFVNDVAEQAAKEKVKNEGMASIIKYEGDNSTFVWKHPIEDFNYGSQLIVHESQEAIFFKDGQALDTFGPGRYTLETQQLPMMEKVYRMPAYPGQTFHSEIYFINKTVQMAVKWGTPEKVRFIDPLTSVPLEIGASGEMNLEVSDGRKLLLKLVGTMKGISWEGRADTVYHSKNVGQTYDPRSGGTIVTQQESRQTVGSGFAQSLAAAFRPMITTAVKTNLSAAIKKQEIDILEVDSKLEELAEALRQKINAGFEEYGLSIPQLYITSVVLPENDPNFKLIREMRATLLMTKVYQAQATVGIAEQQKEAAVEAARRGYVLQQEQTLTEKERQKAERTVIQAQAMAQAERERGMAKAEVMHAQGYDHMAEIQADVQKEYAKGIGNMGSNAGGGSGGGGSIMSDIMGITVGMKAMEHVMPQVGNMINGMQASAPANGGVRQAPVGVTPAATWTCPSCGAQHIVSKFCPECGAPKPVPVKGWTCPNCGKQNITSKFCPDCGTQKPAEPEGWTCPNCGAKDIKSKFCPECGAKKPEPVQGWTCPDCGTTDIKTNFCPECGKKKEGVTKDEAE